VNTVLKVIAIIAAAWIQVAAFGHVRPLGVVPNVMMIVVALFALWGNATTALVAAVGGGLLLDLAAGGGPFGLRMGFLVVLVLAIVAFRQRGMQSDSVVTGLAVVAIATVVFNIAILATIPHGINAVVVSRIARELVDNLIITGSIYLLRANLSSNRGTSMELGPRIGL
jgi:hypothetical protein